MNRREFLQMCAALGASLPMFSVLGCGPDEGSYWDFDVNFDGKVVVIGAGAAGLAAGYLLHRYGIDFEILEANPRIGGRVKRLEGLVDFPIDLGAEWIHEDPSVLAALIDDPNATGSIDVVPYSPDSVANYANGQLRRFDFGGNYYSEYKFKRTTWFGFLDRHIAPNLMANIRLSTPVASVRYGDDRIVVTDSSGGEVLADRVVVTAPIKILQSRGITFEPELPPQKQAAIDAVSIPPGIKVFLEFDRAFYPDITLVGPVFAQEKIYYNAAFRKESPHHVLALFWVSEDASVLTGLADDDQIIEAVLADLDEMFDGQATTAFIQGVVQNWSAQPYAQGAYSYGFGDDEAATLAALQAPVDGRIFFAGEALSAENGATVPGAMQSAYGALRELLRG